MSTSTHPVRRIRPAAVLALTVCLFAWPEITRAELLPYDGYLPIEFPLLTYWENTGRLKDRARNSLGTISPRFETMTIDSAAGIFDGELTVVPSGVRKPSEHSIVGERLWST